MSLDYLCQRQGILLVDLRKVNISGLILCYLNMRLHLLWPPPCAVVNVMELLAPWWVTHLSGTGLFVLQHEMDDDGQ